MTKKNNPFDYLKRQANVKPLTLRAKTQLFIFIGLVVILLFIIMCFHTGNNKTKTKPSNSLTKANDSTLIANANRLKALEQASLQKNLTAIKPATDSKASLARMNAPTQVYSATYLTNSTTSEVKSIKLLVGQNGYNQFANSQAQTSTIVKAQSLQHPNLTIAQGEFIHAVLETAINSDLPGMARAVVTQPVYAYSEERCLIPAGSRLIGQYTSLAGNGRATERVFVIWNRIITPQGTSLMLNSPGTDTLGRAGIAADVVNTHFFRTFSTAALLSLMAATTASYQVDSFDQPNSANQYQQSIAEAFQQAAKNSLQSNSQIKPTLMIHQGTAITVFVAHDLDFSSTLNNE